MSKRKFGFQGFGINKQTTYNFERSQPPQRLYVPPSSRRGGAGGGSHDNYEDHDLDDIEYDDDRDENVDEQVKESNGNRGGEEEEEEIDPLDAFMEGIHEEMKAPVVSKPKEKVDKYKDVDEEDDHIESFFSRVNFFLHKISRVNLLK